MKGLLLVLLFVLFLTVKAQNSTVLKCSPPCENAGVCQNGMCLCSAGWAGDYCETRMALSAVPITVLVGFVVNCVFAWQLAKVTSYLQLPLITGYLIAGIIAGPFVLNLVPLVNVRQLDFIDRVSLGFIVFAAGGKLDLQALKGRWRVIFYNVGCFIVFNYMFGFVIVFSYGPNIQFIQGMTNGQVAAIGSILGTIMLSLSPSSAIAVVSEVRGKGPFTSLTLGVNVVLDMIVILFFSVDVLVLMDYFDNGLSPSVLFLKSVARMSISILVGGILGKYVVHHILWTWTDRLPDFKNKYAEKAVDLFQIFLFCFICWAIFVVEQYSNNWIDALLLTMVAGLMLANFTEYREDFLHILHTVAPYVFLFFFTVTGVSMNLRTFENSLELASIIFFLRIFGLMVGSYVSGKIAGESEKSNRRAGLTYITQAGVSLGLAKEIELMFPGWGAGFTTTIVTAVVASQFIGPALHKFAIRSMGEASTIAGTKESGSVVIFVDDFAQAEAEVVGRILTANKWFFNVVNVSRLKIGERKTVDSPVAQAEHSVSISDTAAPAESARSTTSTAADSAGEGPASVASEPAVPAAAVGVQIVPPGQPVDAAAWEAEINSYIDQAKGVVCMCDDTNAVRIAWLADKHTDIACVVLARAPADGGKPGLSRAPTLASLKKEGPPVTPGHRRGRSIHSSRRFGSKGSSDGKSAPKVLPQRCHLIQSGIAGAIIVAQTVMGAATVEAGILDGFSQGKHQKMILADAVHTDSGDAKAN